MMMLEEVKKPIKYEPFNKGKDMRTLPQVKPPASQQGKRLINLSAVQHQPVTMKQPIVKAPIERVLNKNQSNKRIIIDANNENK